MLWAIEFSDQLRWASVKPRDFGSGAQLSILIHLRYLSWCSIVACFVVWCDVSRAKDLDSCLPSPSLISQSVFNI